MRLSLKPLAAFILGALAGPYLVWCWAQVASRGLVFDPLFAAGLRGAGLQVAVASADFAVSLLLLAPFALAVSALGRAHTWRHIVLASVGMLLSTAVIVGVPALPPTASAAVTILSPFVALAAGVWLGLKVHGRTPNNSFKQNMLRSSKRRH